VEPLSSVDKICACGCKTKLPDTCQWNYIWGHKKRIREVRIVCACGCGELIPSVGFNGQPRVYKLGHNPPPNKLSRGTVLCACGCGKEVQVKFGSVNQGQFVHGHNRRDREILEIIDRGILKGSEDECWPWLGASHDAGYGVIRNGGKNMRVTRILWEHEHGPIPPGMLVCHHCDNPPCCNGKHFFLGTHQDNMDDMVSKGRGRKGKRYA
jgi:hypothetical protein